MNNAMIVAQFYYAPIALYLQYGLIIIAAIYLIFGGAKTYFKIHENNELFCFQEKVVVVLNPRDVLSPLTVYTGFNKYLVSPKDVEFSFTEKKRWVSTPKHGTATDSHGNVINLKIYDGTGYEQTVGWHGDFSFLQLDNSSNTGYKRISIRMSISSNQKHEVSKLWGQLRAKLQEKNHQIQKMVETAS